MNRHSLTNNGGNLVSAWETIIARYLTVKKLLVIFAVIFVCLISFGWYAWRSYNQYKHINQKYHKIVKLDGIIIHLDEVLTMSAHMAAETNELEWEERYRKFEPQLDSAIKEIMLLAPETFMAESAAKTDAANIKLVAMENKVFDLIHEGKHKAALALLHSQEYKKQKHIYSTGMHQYIETLEKYYKTHVAKQNNLFLGITIFVGFILLLAAISGSSMLQLRVRLADRKLAEDRIMAANQQLRANEQQLRAANQQLQTREENLQQINHNLGERVKELDCMYGVANSIRERDSLEVILQDIVTLIPTGWHYPEITRAKICFDGTEYVSQPFEKTQWKQASDIVMDGEQHGYVEVYYMEERPMLDEGPFLKEERSLLDGIARALSEAAEHEQAEDATRLAYEELERANKNLKKMQSQMVQSEKLASIGQLAAGVAHEMNTPVGFVVSNFQTLESYMKKVKKLLGMYDELTTNIETLAKDELLDKAGIIGQSRGDMKIDFVLEDIQDLFDDSKEGLERVTDIIQNLRDFSRIDQLGSLDKYNLNEGIKATLMVAQNEIKYDADIKTEFSELPTILCHSDQINQVLLNILVNAAQAIKSQETESMGTIIIKTYAAGSEVICEISDDGPGIEPDKVPKIFDPFFTTRPVGSGTGLGLSVSYDIIVHKHDGKLLVDSVVGKGTKITIKLPIKQENQNDEKEIISDGKENSIICRR